MFAAIQVILGTQNHKQAIMLSYERKLIRWHFYTDHYNVMMLLNLMLFWGVFDEKNTQMKQHAF